METQVFLLKQFAQCLILVKQTEEEGGGEEVLIIMIGTTQF
jgi:hypothetical protein